VSEEVVLSKRSLERTTEADGRAEITIEWQGKQILRMVLRGKLDVDTPVLGPQ